MSGARPFDPALHLDANLATLGLTLEPEWREDAIANMLALKRAADLIATVTLGDDAEPAAIFEPGERTPER